MLAGWWVGKILTQKRWIGRKTFASFISQTNFLFFEEGKHVNVNALPMVISDSIAIGLILTYIESNSTRTNHFVSVGVCQAYFYRQLANFWPEWRVNCNIMYYCEKNIVQFVFITSVCSCIDENTALSPPLQCNEETNIKTYHLQGSSLELQFVFVPGSCYYFHHQLLSLQDQP